METVLVDGRVLPVDGELTILRGAEIVHECRVRARRVVGGDA